jgi:hypothetical protein
MYVRGSIAISTIAVPVIGAIAGVRRPASALSA